MFTILFAAIVAVFAALFILSVIDITLSTGIKVGLAVATISIGLLTYPITHHIVQRGAIGGFHQFLNGSIVETKIEHNTCHRDGSCDRTYECDVSYHKVVDQRAYTDTKGVYHAEQSHQERESHQCPYATEEFTYKAYDSIYLDGHDRQHVIASHIFSDHPQEWRSGSGIPGNVARGIPPLWQKMYDGVKTGNLYAITATDYDYDNYILADEDTILRESSDDISELKKLKLLPDHTQNLHDPLHDGVDANKVSFVGFSPDNAAEWQQKQMKFNAALGMELQGDMHTVAIKASSLPSDVSPESYLQALKAHWLNNLGKYALPKNGIVLVIGVDDSASTVLWSQATTGMPKGNSGLTFALSHELEDKPFNPETLFGDTTAHVVSDKGKLKAEYTVGSGLIPQIVMVEHPFARACMECDDKGEAETEGFTYLSTDIPVGGGAKALAILVDYFIFVMMWGFAAFYVTDSGGYNTPGRPRRMKYRSFDGLDPFADRDRLSL